MREGGRERSGGGREKAPRRPGGRRREERRGCGSCALAGSGLRGRPHPKSVWAALWIHGSACGTMVLTVPLSWGRSHRGAPAAQECALSPSTRAWQVLSGLHVTVWPGKPPCRGGSSNPAPPEGALIGPQAPRAQEGGGRPPAPHRRVPVSPAAPAPCHPTAQGAQAPRPQASAWPAASPASA